MIERLREIIDGVIDREGGFVDHSADRGGPTMYGITEAVARASGYFGPMDQMPRTVAEGIYHEQYIKAPGFARIIPMSEPIATEVIDTAVNMGPATAGRFLQRTLNCLNRDGRTYGDIPVDGLCGPQTRGALRACLDSRPNAEHLVLVTLNGLQLARYVEIVEANGTQEAFFAGWVEHRVRI